MKKDEIEKLKEKFVLGLVIFVVVGAVWAYIEDPSIFSNPDPTPEEVAQEMYDLGFRAYEENGKLKVYNAKYYEIDPNDLP